MRFIINEDIDKFSKLKPIYEDTYYKLYKPNNKDDVIYLLRFNPEYHAKVNAEFNFKHYPNSYYLYIKSIDKIYWLNLQLGGLYDDKEIAIDIIKFLSNKKAIDLYNFLKENDDVVDFSYYDKLMAGDEHIEYEYVGTRIPDVLKPKIYRARIADIVTTIKPEAFWGCSNLLDVEVPNSVQIIGSNAFRGCYNLKTIHLKEGLTHIGAFAFIDNARLDNIKLPKSLERVDRGAFYGCYKLSNINYAGTEDDWNKIKIDNSQNLNNDLITATKHYSN